MTDFATLRSDMVEHQIAARGVRAKRVLDAMLAVPRETRSSSRHGITFRRSLAQLAGY